MHLQRDLKEGLTRLVSRARNDLLVCSPFVGRTGADLVALNLTGAFRKSGHLSLITDLSPLNVCQSSTDPAALEALSNSVRHTTFRHLPRLHAKVYVADEQVAIVTSANLTAGGLFRNYEYGIELSDCTLVRRMRKDILEYAELGAVVGRLELKAYCSAAIRLRGAFERNRRSVSADLQKEFKEKIRTVADDLIRLRLGEGALHTVFGKTIQYLLRRYGPMTTRRLHPLVASIHPDLCDDTVDRIIDGKRFGKKWKHAVRTAQQDLKKKGIIEFDGREWRTRSQ